MNHNMLDPLMANRSRLIQHVRERLAHHGMHHDLIGRRPKNMKRDSAVLLALTDKSGCAEDADATPCLIFNKRSREIRQPGDLCFPGGSIARWDKALAKLMHLSASPLKRWDRWAQWQCRHNHNSSRLALLLTTGLREAWEEMRLNPLRVTFLGPLPAQRLVMFDRLIYPLAAWIPPSQKLIPNWEVERIVPIPLHSLLNPEGYGLYRLNIRHPGEQVASDKDFRCFIYQDGKTREVLWGASFRITMDFLKRAFDFSPPHRADLPVIRGRLKRSYLSGSRSTTTDKRGRYYPK